MPPERDLLTPEDREQLNFILKNFRETFVLLAHSLQESVNIVKGVLGQFDKKSGALISSFNQASRKVQGVTREFSLLSKEVAGYNRLFRDSRRRYTKFEEDFLKIRKLIRENLLYNLSEFSRVLQANSELLSKLSVKKFKTLPEEFLKVSRVLKRVSSSLEKLNQGLDPSEFLSELKRVLKEPSSLRNVTDIQRIINLLPEGLQEAYRETLSAVQLKQARPGVEVQEAYLKVFNIAKEIEKAAHETETAGLVEPLRRKFESAVSLFKNAVKVYLKGFETLSKEELEINRYLKERQSNLNKLLKDLEEFESLRELPGKPSTRERLLMHAKLLEIQSAIDQEIKSIKESSDIHKDTKFLLLQNFNSLKEVSDKILPVTYLTLSNANLINEKLEELLLDLRDGVVSGEEAQEELEEIKTQLASIREESSEIADRYIKQVKVIENKISYLNEEWYKSLKAGVKTLRDYFEGIEDLTDAQTKIKEIEEEFLKQRREALRISDPRERIQRLAEIDRKEREILQYLSAYAESEAQRQAEDPWLKIREKLDLDRIRTAQPGGYVGAMAAAFPGFTAITKALFGATHAFLGSKKAARDLKYLISEVRKYWGKIKKFFDKPQAHTWGSQAKEKIKDFFGQGKDQFVKFTEKIKEKVRQSKIMPPRGLPIDPKMIGPILKWVGIGALALGAVGIWVHNIRELFFRGKGKQLISAIKTRREASKTMTRLKAHEAELEKETPGFKKYMEDLRKWNLGKGPKPKPLIDTEDKVPQSAPVIPERAPVIPEKTYAPSELPKPLEVPEMEKDSGPISATLDKETTRALVAPAKALDQLVVLQKEANTLLEQIANAVGVKPTKKVEFSTLEDVPVHRG